MFKIFKAVLIHFLAPLGQKNIRTRETQNLHHITAGRKSKAKNREKYLFFLAARLSSPSQQLCLVLGIVVQRVNQVLFTKNNFPMLLETGLMRD